MQFKNSFYNKQKSVDFCNAFRLQRKCCEKFTDLFQKCNFSTKQLNLNLKIVVQFKN